MKSLKLTLYSYFRSSASYRVRIALNLKGLSYETVPIHLVKRMQHEDPYSRINPSQEVPTLVHGDRVLAQSMAIILYLEEAFPEPALLPCDSFLKAKVLEAAEIINSGIQPLQNLRVLEHLEKICPTESDRGAWANFWISRGLNALEKTIKPQCKLLENVGGLTFLQCFLIPQLVAAQRFQIKGETYPTLWGIYEGAKSHPAFIKAAPENQPDYPG